MAHPQLELGDAELEVLSILWDRGQATVREVLGVLNGRGKSLAYTTVLTFLTRLEQKGYATSNKNGLAYVYMAKVSRSKVARARLRSVMQQLFDGAPGAMVLQLMETERFTPEELAQFRHLIDELDTDPGGHRARRRGRGAGS